MLTTPGDLNSVKLSDFGVVRILEDASKADGARPQILSQVGSVAYMGTTVATRPVEGRCTGRRGLTRCAQCSMDAAPEIFLGKPYDESVDMWACGVLLYMLYVHSLPQRKFTVRGRPSLTVRLFHPGGVSG